MAFYASTGGIVIQQAKTGSGPRDRDAWNWHNRYDPVVVRHHSKHELNGEAVLMYAELDPTAFDALALDHEMVVDRSKLSTMRKLLSALQATWFLAQCVSRIKQGLAISLLELTTFGNCITAFCVYVIWWHKPSDVTTHETLESDDLPLEYSMLLKTLEISDKDVFDNSLRLEEAGSGEESYTTIGYLDYGKLRRVLSDLHMQASFSIPGTGLRFMHKYLPSIGDTTSCLPHCAQLIPEELQGYQRLWRLRQINAKFCDLAAPYGGAIHSRRNGFLTCQARATVKCFGPLSTGCILVACFFYRALYWLAHYDYNFNTKFEESLWRTSSGYSLTLAGGLFAFLLLSHLFYKIPTGLRTPPFSLSAEFKREWVLFAAMLNLIIIIDIFTRSCIVIESFVALPSSAPSVYKVPLWSTYFPHF